MHDNYFQFNLFFLLQLVEVEFDLACFSSDIFHINLYCQFFFKFFNSYLDDIQTTWGCSPRGMKIHILKILHFSFIPKEA